MSGDDTEAVRALDEEAVIAATEALHRGDSYCCDCADPDQHDQFWRRDRTDAVRALECARPFLEAAERERIAVLAEQEADRGRKSGLDRIALRAFAQSLRKSAAPVLGQGETE